MAVPAELWMFVGALAVIYLVPGADMLLVLDSGATQPRASAAAVVLGLASARALHVALAALGLAALLASAPWAFAMLRTLGAAYLLWLALQILRAPLPPAGETHAGLAPLPCSAAFRRGLLTNLLNPKALLFCSVLLPQFVTPQRGGLLLQFLLLGVVLVAVGVVFDGLYALAGRQMGQGLARRPRLQRLQRQVFAGLLALLALQLLLG